MARISALVLAVGLFWTWVAHGALRSPACEMVLSGFAQGLDDDKSTIGYIGISQKMMEHLVNTGHLETGDHANELTLHITDEHPVGDVVVRADSQILGDDFSRKTAISIATRAATRLSTFDLIKGRALKRGRGFSPEGDRYLKSVLEEILDLKVKARGRYTYSVSFLELEVAAYNSRVIPMDDPVRPDDYSVTVARQKLKRLVQALGFSVEGLDVKSHVARMNLTSLFADLPNQAGYILGARSSLVFSKGSIEPKILKFDAGDVAGIEPIGDNEFNYMTSLQK